jgi:hypothetical protein
MALGADACDGRFLVSGLGVHASRVVGFVCVVKVRLVIRHGMRNRRGL